MVTRFLCAFVLSLSCVTAMAETPFFKDFMICGTRRFELLENRQLTFREDGGINCALISPDGKSVAYGTWEAERRTKLCVMSLSSGRSSVLLDGVSVFKTLDSGESLPSGFAYVPGWQSDAIAWSPDSRKLAVMASKITQLEGGCYTEESGLYIVATKGGSSQYIPLPKDYCLVGNTISWSPDGSKIAVGYYLTELLENGLPGSGIWLINSATGSAESIHSEKGCWIEKLEWTKAGNSLKCVLGGLVHQDKEIYLDGRPAAKLGSSYDRYEFSRFSSDGAFKYHLSKDSTIVSVSSGQTIRTLDTKGGRFRSWVPNSHLYLYSRETEIKGENDNQKRNLSTLWLSNLEDTKYNHLCITSDYDSSAAFPSWSSDGLKMAYVSKGRLYVAEFGWAELDPFEKLEYDLPLTEEDEKTVLASHAKELGVAIIMYSQDWDGKLPAADSVDEDIRCHLKTGKAQLKPDKYHFTYYPHDKMSDIEDPANTIIGTVDSSFDWKISIYADGHVMRVRD